jgi:hypothetical protein
VKASSACKSSKALAAAWDFRETQIVNERKRPFQRLRAKQTELLYMIHRMKTEAKAPNAEPKNDRNLVVLFQKN